MDQGNINLLDYPIWVIVLLQHQSDMLRFAILSGQRKFQQALI